MDFQSVPQLAVFPGQTPLPTAPQRIELRNRHSPSAQTLRDSDLPGDAAWDVDKLRLWLTPCVGEGVPHPDSLLYVHSLSSYSLICSLPTFYGSFFSGERMVVQVEPELQKGKPSSISLLSLLFLPPSMATHRCS